jgi:phosphomannomutase
MVHMRPPFIKKFDFRGIYNKDITEKDAYYLGYALAKTIPLKKVLIGWDTRASSKQLALHFIAALPKESEVFYLDVCPIDYVTAGAYALDFDLSIMFTGSHNPWNWTGLLMHTRGGVSIEGEMVDKIVTHYEDAVATVPFKEIKESSDLKNYQNAQAAIETLYAKRIQEILPLASIKPLKILIDIGDGSGYKALDLLEKLLPQVSFVRLHDKRVYDAASSHTADPSEIKNMQELIQAIKKGTYDCGFAFDSDADRVLAVDEKGSYVNGSLLGSALYESFQYLGLASNTVGYAVDCGPSLYNTVTHVNPGHVIPVAVGRSIVRGMVLTQKIDIGVENVGHFYLKEFFATDSGVFSLAVILYWLSQHGALSTLAQKHPDGEREQLFVPVTDEKVREGIEKDIQTQFATAKKITLDGVRYELFDAEQMHSWVAIRKSGYEAIEKYYFGSLDHTTFSRLASLVKKSI